MSRFENSNFNQIGTFSNIVDNQHRKFNPKICVNLWCIGRSQDQIRSAIQAGLDMGIEGFILCIHLDWDSANSVFTTEENTDDMLAVAREFYSQGVYFSSIKFHCTETTLATNSTVQTVYQSSVTNYINKFNGLGIKNCIIFNERVDMFTQSNVSYIQGVISAVKALGLKVSINTSGIDNFLNNYVNFSNITSNYDYVSINTYPNCGAKKSLTTVDDCKKAWNDHIRFSGFVDGAKPFILTETGIRPYHIYFASPAAYAYDDPNDYDTNVYLTYYRGLFESGIKEIAEEVWLWFFPETFNQSVANLIHAFTGRGI